MTNEERLERMRGLVQELAEHLAAFGGDGPELAARVELRARVIAQFMGLVTPISIPTEFEAARATFMSLAAEAEFVGRRGNGGHCWRVRLGPYNGEFLIWTQRDRTIEKVEYGT